jgi:hypothetical protein
MSAQRKHEGLGNSTGAENSRHMIALYRTGCGYTPDASISKYRLMSYRHVSLRKLYIWRFYPLS